MLGAPGAKAEVLTAYELQQKCLKAVPSTVTELHEAYDAGYCIGFLVGAPITCLPPTPIPNGVGLNIFLGLGDFRNISTPPHAKPLLLRSMKRTAAKQRRRRVDPTQERDPSMPPGHDHMTVTLARFVGAGCIAYAASLFAAALHADRLTIGLAVFIGCFFLTARIWP
jgi:hypothetical protein